MKPKIIIAKPGLDGHDRGAKVIAHSFRDAGYEVIYLGLRQTPEMIVEAALEEDADAIGVSCLSGAHMALFPKILELLKEKQLDRVVLIGGGVIPQKDIETLEKMGVHKLFGPGTPTREIIEYANGVLTAPTP